MTSARSVMRSLLLAAGVLVGASAAASSGGALEQSGVDLNNTSGLQRGAALYMNYCSGCHSLKYLRYSRMAEDLGLSEADVQASLNFSDAKFGETIGTSMPSEPAKQWFGQVPPDLSVISRVRGGDWIYTYLKSFYLDEARPVGWNNTLFPNASMPNPLWQLQGLQRPVYGRADVTGERPVEHLTLAQPGRLQPEQFDQVARDITAFLEYAGEPAVLKREKLGVWVILFLAFFTFLAWLLKHEYWRDVK